MNILQLCCFTDLWHSRHHVTSIDLKDGIDLFQLSDDIGKEFDFIVSAPPCTQFTIANNRNWSKYPKKDIELAKKCFTICTRSGTYWMLENPPGRIEKFIPELKNFRIGVWSGVRSCKRYIIYSNLMFIFNCGNSSQHIKRNKRTREAWQPDFIAEIERCLP